MLVVYVAGAFSAPTPRGVHLNVERAEAVAADLWRNGIAALCPHSLGRNLVGVAEESVFLAGGLELLKRSDAVLVVEKWEGSRGTNKELAYAVAEGIPVFFSLPSLLTWNEGRP